MSQYQYDLNLLIQNRSTILSDLDDFSFSPSKKTIWLENIFSGYTLVKFLLHFHFPSTGIKVIDDLPDTYYKELGVRHVLTSDYNIFGDKPSDRSYAILIFTSGSAVPSFDSILIQAIKIREHYNKLCIVGPLNSEFFSETFRSDITWNFKASIPSLKAFGSSNGLLKFDTTTSEFIGRLLQENIEFKGLGNTVILMCAELWNTISPLRNVILINNCDDVDKIMPYNENNVLVVDSTPSVFRRMLMRIYTGSFPVARILICESLLRTYTFDSQFGYHSKSITDKRDFEMILSEWKSLTDNIPLVSIDIKVFHLASKNDHDKLNFKPLPCTPNTALLSLKWGLKFPLKHIDPVSQKICLYQLYLLGYVDSSFKEYSDDHPFWKLTAILSMKQLLDPIWISLAATIDCALIADDQEVIAQVLIFAALIYYCDTTSFKLSTLLYDIPMEYKTVESEILSILNYLHNSPDALPLKGKLDKIDRLFRKSLHLNTNSNEQSLSDDLTEKIISCFKRSFFMNIGVVGLIDVADNKDSITRVRIMSHSKSNMHSIPKLHLKIPEYLREYYHTNQLLAWIKLYQPLSGDKQVPFIGFKLTKSDVLRAESYYALT